MDKMEACFEYDLQKICRACKMESREMQPVFTILNNPLLNNYPVLSDMLMACSSVQVAIGDGLPTTMCDPCIQQLILAYNFKKQCEDTDTSLRLLLKECLIKEESAGGDADDILVYEDDYKNTDSDTKSNELHESLLRGNTRLKKSGLPTLSCKYCSKEFEFFSHLQRHVRRHNQQKVFVCKICDKRLTRLEHLKRHMVIHLKTKPHICRICKRGFNHIDNLYNHEKRCKGDRTFVCEICNRGFNRPDALEAHMSNHDTSIDIKPMLESLDNIERYIKVENLDSHHFTDLLNPKVEIIESDAEQTTSELLASEKENVLLSSLKVAPNADDEAELTEILTPPARKRGRPKKGEVRLSKTRLKYKRLNIDYILGGNSLTCRVCQKKFKRTSHLKRHLLSHAETKPFLCSLCSKTFTRRDHMLRHVKLHSVKKEFKCDLCLRAFLKDEQLVQHKAVKHNIGERTITEKKFQCEICYKSFTTEKYRDTHVKAHSEEKEKIFACKTCETIFPSKNDLMDHEKKNSECSKKYLCSECGQRFIRKNYLVVHMRRHRGEKPYKCKFCGKGFPRSTDVTRHEKYHTGEKNHLCIICGKGFGRAYNLTLHMRTHTGEKPYACTYCDAAFAQSNDLKAHVRRHTGERYHCDLCTDAFLMGYLLKQHKRNVHGIECPSQRVQPIKNDTS